MRPITKALRPKFTPARLFAAGAQGAWYDPSSLWGAADHLPRRNLLTSTATLATQTKTVTAVSHTLYLKGTGSVTLSGAATGTLNGTGASDRVSLTFTPTAGSLTLTVSGTVTEGHLTTTATTDHSYQAVTDWTTEQYAWAAAKNVPWLRRNLLTNTVFAGAVAGTPGTYPTGWTIGSATGSLSIPSTGILTFSASSARQFVTQNFVISTVVGQTYTFTLNATVESGSLPLQDIIYTNTATRTQYKVNSVNANALDSISTGTYSLELLITATATTTSIRLGVGCANAVTASVTISEPNVVVGSSSTTYQPIGASWEAQFAALAASAGVVPTLYQDSAGTTPVTGPDSVVGFLGDLAQGYAGSELCSNGTFADATGWTLSDATVTISGGTLNFASTTNKLARYDLPTAKVATYLVTFTVTSYTSGAPFLTIGQGSVATFSASVGYKSLLVTSAATDTGLRIYAGQVGTGGTYSIDNVSIRELPGYHAIQSGATGLKPTLRLNPNGYWYIQRDLSDDALVTTFPNLGAACASYINDGSTVTETTGLTLNGALTQNTPAADYGRVYLNAPSSKAAQLIKWLKAKAGL